VTKKIHNYFFRQVDASSLAVFRIVFGLLLLFECVNYGLFLCLDCMYRNTELLFKYHHFEWVTLSPGNSLQLHFLIMGIAAIGITMGLFYRLSVLIYTLGFFYLFLLDQALYLNHFYLVILYLIIMFFIPANRYLALDARRRPNLASNVVPNWGRFWLGAQTEIVLLYAGYVKITYDWLNLEPMRLWMNNRSHDEMLLFQWLTMDWGIALASYGAIILHLIGAPLLLWRRTRLYVLACYGFFHLVNALVFNIGIFPFMTFGATLMLFDPDWPKQFLRYLSVKSQVVRAWFAKSIPESASDNLLASQYGLPMKTLLVCGISIWLLFQILVPLRHHLAPGHVSWNEDGHRFSWRMKLRSKTGAATFVVVAEDGQRWVVDPVDHLNWKQSVKMACIPDLIWQFAQYLDDQYNDDGQRKVGVFVDARCSLNTRKPAPLIKRLVDLTQIPRDEPASNWVLPLTERLPAPYFPCTTSDRACTRVHF